MNIVLCIQYNILITIQIRITNAMYFKEMYLNGVSKCR